MDRAAHHRDEIDVSQLAGRDVDRDADIIAPSFAQFLCEPAGFDDNPVAERNDDAALFGIGDEPGRRHSAVFGTVPAQ